MQIRYNECDLSATRTIFLHNYMSGVVDEAKARVVGCIAVREDGWVSWGGWYDTLEAAQAAQKRINAEQKREARATLRRLANAA